MTKIGYGYTEWIWNGLEWMISLFHLELELDSESEWHWVGIGMDDIPV